MAVHHRYRHHLFLVYHQIHNGHLQNSSTALELAILVHHFVHPFEPDLFPFVDLLEPSNKNRP
jgi:hypothetical protein